MDKAEILGCQDSPLIEAAVPEWPCRKIWIRTMSGRERDAYEVSVNDTRIGDRLDLNNFRARLLVIVLADEAGKRLFADTDFASLGEKSGVVIDRLARLARSHNKLGPEEADTEKKGSPTTTGGGSSTVTPAS